MGLMGSEVWFIPSARRGAEVHPREERVTRTCHWLEAIECRVHSGTSGPGALMSVYFM
jgi:hypothetical protein